MSIPENQDGCSQFIHSCVCRAPAYSIHPSIAGGLGFSFIELVPGNAEAFTEGLDGRTVQESFRQDTEDKKEAITGIGDDHIREDGMGMPAAYADQPEDRDFLCDGFPMDKIDDAAAIVSMDMAVSGGIADGAGLPFGAERSHIGLEQNF